MSRATLRFSSMSAFDRAGQITAGGETAEDLRPFGDEPQDAAPALLVRMGKVEQPLRRRDHRLDPKPEPERSISVSRFRS